MSGTDVLAGNCNKKIKQRASELCKRRQTAVRDLHLLFTSNICFTKTLEFCVPQFYSLVQCFFFVVFFEKLLILYLCTLYLDSSSVRYILCPIVICIRTIKFNGMTRFDLA